uniref:Uncharacterized protein n=1 Tax=Anguilla anguilla TaxID=7936 RepID=A0A0E9QDP8_ANGAN
MHANNQQTTTIHPLNLPYAAESTKHKRDDITASTLISNVF